ncbi:MAG: PLP-dependent aminotransferase family protein [Acholeplasmatales bacterium]|nr:PLP-dependent aminotransferase family protein [Acholeplasmatales bacterium]
MKNKPKYIEIYEDISKKINDGIYLPNEKIPSKRELAINLNTSLNTVINAYNLLIDEGYIYTVSKKGYFVSDQIKLDLKAPEVKYKKDNIILPLYDFTTKNVHKFDNENYKKIIKEILYSDEYLNKTPFQGDYNLRVAISNHLKINRGINASPDQIYITNGIESLRNIFRILDIDNITLENPGYHRLAKIASNLGMKVNYQDLDDEGIIIPNKRTIIYSTPFNQFPTGIKMSISRKKELIKFINDTDSYLIEDDFDAEFRIKDSPKSPLFNLDSKRVIFFSTFSETLYPGLRLSYFILPYHLKSLYDTHYSGYSNNVPTLEQIIVRDFINKGFYVKHINKRKKEYLEKRNIIIDYLNKNNIKCNPDLNYLSIIAKIDISNEDKFISDLKDMRVEIDLMNKYDINKKSPNQLIIGYTSITNDKIIEGLNILIDIIKKNK